MHDVLYWNFESPFDREKIRRLVGWRQMSGAGGHTPTQADGTPSWDP